MTTLQDFTQFNGTHWETGSVHKLLDYNGVKAPHTGEPFSEALLLGVIGGIKVGYFTFAYKGYDPQCNILTRNTFNSLDTLLSRLGVVQYLEQTASPQKAAAILMDRLAEGGPAIVWADMWSLPYNAMLPDEDMWGMMPIVVYGYDTEAGTAQVADRAQTPLVVTIEELAAARARVKKTKHRLLTLDAPDPAKLTSAVQAGIWDCINLYTEKPPKGSRNNFGLAALRFWAKMLTSAKGRTSWETVFAAGPHLYAGLTSAYAFAFLFGKGLEADGERIMYASFLEEAALLLNNGALREAAAAFRTSAAFWRALPELLLPESVPPFAEARRLMWQHHKFFLQQGQAALDEMKHINSRLAEIRASMAEEFPLTIADAAKVKEAVADQIMAIHDAEAAAVHTLKSAMS